MSRTRVYLLNSEKKKSRRETQSHERLENRFDFVEWTGKLYLEVVIYSSSFNRQYSSDSMALPLYFFGFPNCFASRQVY